MKLFPELMTKSEDSRSLDWVTLRLLNVFPEDLNDDERLYIRAALDPIRCAKGREAIKASLSEIIDYYEFAEARARIPSSKLTPWKMLALAVPACFVAGVLSHPRLAGPTYAFSGLATYGLGLAMLYIKDKQWKPRLAYTDRVRADVLLKNKFEQLYSKAPSWEQIFNPKTVVEKWLLRSYFAVMHADARDPRFYPDNWIYEQGLITYTHWASFRFLEFICHHYDGGHFAAKGARHNPYLGYLRYVGSGEL